MRQVTQTVFEEAISMSCEASHPASQLGINHGCFRLQLLLLLLLLQLLSGASVFCILLGITWRLLKHMSSWQCWTVQLRLAV